MSEDERMKNYDDDYFFGGGKRFPVDFSRQLYHYKLLRMDQVTSICFAYGCYDLRVARKAYMAGKSYREQLKVIKEHQTRHPHLVIDVGCGRGELSAVLLYDGVECMSIEPSSNAIDMIQHTLTEWDVDDKAYLVNCGACGGIAHLVMNGKKPDTAIFCESIEHIPEAEGDNTMLLLSKIFEENQGRLIIANSEHPILKQGDWPPMWDHIRTIDDDVYDMYSRLASRVLFRDGGYMVLEF